MADTDRLLNYLVGQVMKNLKAQGKYADPVLILAILNEIIEEELEKRIQNKTVETTSEPQV